MRGQVADVIEQARKVQELMSGFVKRHFETIPAASVAASPYLWCHYFVDFFLECFRCQTIQFLSEMI